MLQSRHLIRNKYTHTHSTWKREESASGFANFDLRRGRSSFHNLYACSSGYATVQSGTEQFSKCDVIYPYWSGCTSFPEKTIYYTYANYTPSLFRLINISSCDTANSVSTLVQTDMPCVGGCVYFHMEKDATCMWADKFDVYVIPLSRGEHEFRVHFCSKTGHVRLELDNVTLESEGDKRKKWVDVLNELSIFPKGLNEIIGTCLGEGPVLDSNYVNPHAAPCRIDV